MAPAYDLAQDVRARQEEARRDLGAGVRVQVVEDVFVIAARSGATGAVEFARRALRAYFNDRFHTKPTRAISVYLFPEAGSYERYCRARLGEGCTSPYGFYLASDRRIVMDVHLGIGTLTHELIHPLVETDFPQAPDWIDEGIASLFERPTMPKAGVIHGAKNWRHPRLLQALRSKQDRAQASIPALFSMSDRVFRGDKEDLNYATARYFCQWLDAKGWLWPFYQRYRDTYADDPSGRRAFLAITGQTPEQANTEWSRWVRAL
jgi:hypothetical protein